jgi:hypothetical protein
MDAEFIAQAPNGHSVEPRTAPLVTTLPPPFSDSLK